MLLKGFVLEGKKNRSEKGGKEGFSSSREKDHPSRGVGGAKLLFPIAGSKENLPKILQLWGSHNRGEGRCKDMPSPPLPSRKDQGITLPRIARGTMERLQEKEKFRGPEEEGRNRKKPVHRGGNMRATKGYGGHSLREPEAGGK